jgi:hypothetical protein
MSTPILDFSGQFPGSESVRITRFDVSDRITLADVPTVGLLNGSVIDIITGSGTSRVAAEVELQADQANPADPSQIQPSDDLTRHWQVVGGLLP